MKKKSIFVVALAALMLFGFTACEQAVYKVPTGLSVTATRTGYLEGESIDINTISGTLEYSDGSTRSISGSELSIVSAGQNTGVYAVSYGELKATLEVSVYAVDEIKTLAISNLPATVEVNATSVDADGVATLPNGETTNVDVTLTITALTQAGATAEPNITAYAVNTKSYTGKVTGTDDWSVSVVADSDKYDENNIDRLVVEYMVDSKVTNSFYVDETVTFAVYAYDKNGNKSGALTKDADYGVLEGATIPASFTVKETAGDTTYTVYSMDDPTKTATIRAPQGIAYVQSVTFTKKDNAPELSAAGGTLTVGQLATYYDFTLTKHGDTATFTPSESNCVITKGTWEKNEGSGTTPFTPSIMVKVGKDPVWTAATASQLTVAKPAE